MTIGNKSLITIKSEVNRIKGACFLIETIKKLRFIATNY